LLCRDVISIDKATGRITRLGRSIIHSRDFDAMGPNVPLFIYFFLILLILIHFTRICLLSHPDIYVCICICICVCRCVM
jgi:hypothetical protein